MAQKVKNLLALQETWVQSPSQEDSVEEEWQPTPVFLPVEFNGQRRLAGYSPWGRKESNATERITHTLPPYPFSFRRCVVAK